MFCQDCVEEVEARRLCSRCGDEVEALARIRADARLTPRNIYGWIARKSVLVAGAVLVLVVVGLGFVGMAFWRTVGDEVDFALIRRIRAGFMQTFELGEEGFDFAELLNDGQVRPSSQSPDPLHGRDRLNDGLPDPQVPAWRSGDVNLPLDILFWSKTPRLMGKIVIWNHPSEDPSTYIRVFKVFTSPMDPTLDDAQLELVGTFTAGQTSEVQRFEFDPPVPTQYTLIRVISHYGSSTYVSAAEIGLFVPGRPNDSSILRQSLLGNQVTNGFDHPPVSKLTHDVKST